MSSRLRRRLALAAFLAVALAAACTLNPQPLPPGEEPSAAEDGEDGGYFGSGSSGGGQMPTVPADAGVRVSDGGDAGDAGDAGEDADAAGM